MSSDIAENIANIAENTNNSFLAYYKAGNILLTYESKTNGTVTHSSLKVTDYSNNKEKITSTNFVVDIGLPSYKLTSHEGVISEAEKTKKSFNLSEIRNVIKLYEIFGKEILANQQVDHSSQLIQSLFFHNATFRSIERSLEEQTDCGCTPHPGYFIERTSFWCQEDYFIVPSVYIKAIDESNYIMNATEKKVYNYLQNNKFRSSISIDNVLSILEPKVSYMQRVGNVYYNSTNKILKNSPPTTKAACLQGSDLGCCGNYSGCCWYWSLLCLDHDLDCIDCSPSWYCLPGCKKGV